MGLQGDRVGAAVLNEENEGLGCELSFPRPHC